ALFQKVWETPGYCRLCRRGDGGGDWCDYRSRLRLGAAFHRGHPHGLDRSDHVEYTLEDQENSRTRLSYWRCHPWLAALSLEPVGELRMQTRFKSHRIWLKPWLGIVLLLGGLLLVACQHLPTSPSVTPAGNGLLQPVQTIPLPGVAGRI